MTGNAVGSLVCIKGKGDALECVYRGIKTFGSGHESNVIEKRVEVIVLIEMQFGFRPGRGTTAIFIVCREIFRMEERVVDGIP